MSDKKKINLGKKSDITVSIFVDTSTEDLRVLDDQEESKLDKTKLPENIIEFTSVWAKPNWMLSQLIEANSISEKIVQGRTQRFFDTTAMVNSQIRVLLKKWNLQDFDAKYNLMFEKSMDNPRIEILTMDTMHRIGEISPADIITKMMNRMFAGEAPKNVLTPVKEEVKA